MPSLSSSIQNIKRKIYSFKVKRIAKTCGIVLVMLLPKLV